MNREFLKEAIADAKAVKETAIANAKAALEESFTPHLKTMLSAKLEEMEKEVINQSIHIDINARIVRYLMSVSYTGLPVTPCTS